MKLRISLLAAALSFVMMACYPDYDEPQRPALENPAENTNNGMVVATPDTETINLSVQPSDDSNIGDVTLTLVDAIVTDRQPGATSGRLDLMISFTNNTSSDVTLDYVPEDYILLDTGGFELVPTEFTDSLVSPVIPVGETITGELTYATTDATETFNMVVTGYPQFVVDANVVQVTGED